MPDPSLISVVVVTHNSRRHVAACLDAIGPAAGGVPHEVVVVDNGSSDGTAELVESAYPMAHLLRHDNSGFAHAVNRARPYCRGEMLLLVNPDASMEPGSLRCLAEALEGAPTRLAAVGPRLRSPDGSDQVSARPRPSVATIAFEAFMLYHLFPRSRFYRRDLGGVEPREVPCLSGACLLIRATAFDAVGGLDEAFFLYGEDLDLCLRLKREGLTCRHVPGAVVAHEEGGSAFQDRRAFFLHLHRSQSILIRKHFGGASRFVAELAHASGIALRAAAYGARGLLTGAPDYLTRAGHHVAALVAMVGGETRPPR